MHYGGDLKIIIKLESMAHYEESFILSSFPNVGFVEDGETT
jgi:hypothetical protein